MTPRAMRIVTIVAIAAVLSGCESLGGSKQNGETTEPPIEDRGGLTPEEMGIDTSGPEAEPTGVQDTGGFSGSPLVDPSGLLARRVIYFDFDSDAVRADFREVIAAHAEYLAANPGAKVTLEGHADERGSREYNLALAERRALSVRRQMTLLGASARQLDAVSFGEEKPADLGHDEAAYALNRRVEIIY